MPSIFDFANDKGVFLRGNGDGISTVDIYALDDSFTFTSFTIPYNVTALGKNGVDVVGRLCLFSHGRRWSNISGPNQSDFSRCLSDTRKWLGQCRSSKFQVWFMW